MQSITSKFGDGKRPARENILVTIGRIEDLPPGRSATVEIRDGEELALYNIDGEIFAIGNSCPHKGAPLAEGNLCGHVVECDWHGWRFDVRTGDCLNRPSYPVESYEVILEDGLIKVRI